MSHFYLGSTDRVFRSQIERHRFSTEFSGVSATQVADQASCDVNAIMARFQRTGVLPEGRGEGQFGDVTELQADLTAAIEKSRQVIADAKLRVAEANKKRADAYAKQLADDLEELKSLRAAAAAAKAADSGSVEAVKP